MITGVYIWAISIGVMVVNLIIGFALFYNRDDLHPITIILHIVCIIGYLAGIVWFGIGFVHWLSAH